MSHLITKVSLMSHLITKVSLLLPVVGDCVTLCLFVRRLGGVEVQVGLELLETLLVVVGLLALWQQKR